MREPYASRSVRSITILVPSRITQFSCGKPNHAKECQRQQHRTEIHPALVAVPHDGVAEAARDSSVAHKRTEVFRMTGLEATMLWMQMMFPAVLPTA